jgi:CDP-diacylglycerol--glycerol-3-phosphate 3-phosphatidyltransferase
MDRVSELAVFFGLLIWFSDAERSGRTEELLIFLAAAGSILVSYVRARSRIIGVELREGLLPREVRVLLLGIGLIVAGIVDDDVLTWVFGALAALTLVTVLQRLWITWRAADRNNT